MDELKQGKKTNGSWCLLELFFSLAMVWVITVWALLSIQLNIYMYFVLLNTY